MQEQATVHQTQLKETIQEVKTQEQARIQEIEKKLKQSAASASATADSAQLNELQQQRDQDAQRIAELESNLAMKSELLKKAQQDQADKETSQDVRAYNQQKLKQQ